MAKNGMVRCEFCGQEIPIGVAKMYGEIKGEKQKVMYFCSSEHALKKLFNVAEEIQKATMEIRHQMFTLAIENGR